MGGWASAEVLDDVAVVVVGRTERVGGAADVVSRRDVVVVVAGPEASLVDRPGGVVVKCGSMSGKQRQELQPLLSTVQTASVKPEQRQGSTAGQVGGSCQRCKAEKAGGGGGGGE